MAGWICSREFLVTQIVLLLQKTTDGFRFNPTEQQLINHLKSKEPGRREGFCIIPTLENITDFNPKDLPAKFTEKSIIPSNDREWWFISPQTQNQRVRVRRKTPCGSSWGITGQPRDITIGGKKIGFKKILSFPEGKAKKDWIIHEYHLPQDLPNLPQHGLQSPKNSSSLKTTKEDEWVDAMPDADLSCAKVQRGEEPRFEMVQQETGARNIEDEAAAGAQLLPRGLQSPNNSSSSTTHHFTNVGNSSDAEFSHAKVQKGEEPRFEKVQQETAARNIEDEAAASAKDGQLFITENRRSKVEPLNCVFPPEETEGIPSSPLHSSGFLDFSEFGDFFHQPADQEKVKEAPSLVDFVLPFSSCLDVHCWTI